MTKLLNAFAIGVLTLLIGGAADAAFRRNAGFRMDFLMLTPNLAPRLTATGVDSAYRGREKPSDHAPVWAELTPP